MAAGTSGGPSGDFGEVDTIPPALGQKEVDGLAEKYEIPAQFEPRAALPGEVASRPPPGFVAIYRDQLMAGLRLPIPNFFFFILTFWGIRITQVIPNGVRSIIGFFILCRALEIPFSHDLFQAFFQMKVSGKVPGWFYFARRSGAKTPTRELFTGVPSSIKDWKRYFFFVKNLGFPPLTWRAETQVSDPLPDPLPIAELSRLLSSDEKLEVKEFSNAQLWAAGLIRANPSDPSPENRPLSPNELTSCKRPSPPFLSSLCFMHLLTFWSSAFCSEEVFFSSNHRRSQHSRCYYPALLSHSNQLGTSSDAPANSCSVRQGYRGWEEKEEEDNRKEG